MKKRTMNGPGTLAPVVEQIARITEATFDGIFIYDAGRVLDATTRAASLFGRAPQEMNCCSVTDLLAKECQPVVLQHLHSFGNGPCPALGLRKDGSSFPIEITVKASLTLNGRRLQVLALRDLTRSCENYLTDRLLNRSRDARRAALPSQPKSLATR